MRVTLVEPYYGGSHRAWADGYASRSNHDVSIVSHEARFWKWRMHGAFLTLAEELKGQIATGDRPDVLLVSSMMDVAAFAGAVRHMAPEVPIAVYFHESQFTYPLSPADRADATYPMKNWSSASIADLVVFNSVFHRDVFRREAARFLNQFPEYKHVHKVDGVIDRSVVLPVGIDLQALQHRQVVRSDIPLVVWNHRWEHDKGPKDLLAIVGGLIEHGADFRMAMCGEVFVSVPSTFAAITSLLGDRLVHEGWAEPADYAALLSEATVVLSTAEQEFFGIGVIEAVAAGAHPVLPDRLVYPERVSALDFDAGTILYDSPSTAVDLIRHAFERDVSERARRATTIYDWSTIAPTYDKVLAELAAAI